MAYYNVSLLDNVFAFKLSKGPFTNDVTQIWAWHGLYPLLSYHKDSFSYDYISLRTKTCARSDCRFFHLTGTKITAKKEQEKRQPNNYSTTDHDQFQEFQKWQLSQSQKSEDVISKPVFQKAQSSIEDTLALIMN